VVGVKSVEWLGLGSDASGSLLVGAIAASAIVGGIGPGLFAVVLSLAAVGVLFPPGGDLGFNRGDVIWVAAFLAESLIAVVLIALLRRGMARLRAEQGRDAVLAAIAEQAVANRDEGELFRLAVARVGEILKADRAALFVEESGLKLAAQWRWDDAPISVDGDTTRAWLSSFLQPGLHVILADEAPPELRASFRDGPTSVACSTMDLDASRRGFLVAFRGMPDGFTRTDGRFLETVAAILSSAALRRAGEAALARSNERLRVAQNAAHSCTWEWDITTETVLWSDGLEALFGVPPGRSPRTAAELLDLVHPEDRDRVVAAMRQAEETGQFDVRYRANLPEGATRWVGGRGQVFRGDGQPPRVVGVAIDLTEQVRIEDAVRANEQRFRMMANAAPVLIRVSGVDGQCLFVNERWSALTGRPPAEHRGWGWLESVHPDDRDACREAQLHSVARRAPGQWEYRIRDTSGEYRWVLDRNAPFETGDGGFVGFVASSTDITQRRQAEESVRLVAEAGVELGASLDYAEILNRLADFAVPRFADWCVIHAGAENARIPRMTVARGHAGTRFNGTGAGPSDEVIKAACIGVAEGLARSGQTSLAIAGVRAAPSSGDSWDIGPLRDLGVRSGIAVSLAAQNRPLGAILFLRGAGRQEFQPEDRTLAEDLGRRTSTAIENARSTRTWQAGRRPRARQRVPHVPARRQHPAGGHDGPGRDAQAAREPGDATRRGLVHDPRHRPRGRDPDAGHRARRREPGRRRRGVYGEVPAGGEARIPATAHALGRRSALLSGDYGRDVAEARSRRGAPGADPAHGAAFLDHRAARERGPGVCGAGGWHEPQRAHVHEADFATLKELGQRAGVALENAQLYAEAQRRENELMRANEAKDEFLGMMSHELRTPLTIINGGARVLRSRSAELDGETKDAILSDIEGESERLFRMVENLLSLAHLQFGDSFEVEPVHIGRLTEKVITSFSTRRPNRPVTFEVEPGAETFAAQPVYLEQVIRNLLSNADKYSPAGAPIELCVVRIGEGIGGLRVLDRGVGINPEEASLIFERFYRSERASRLAGGSGVGLALCKRLIEAMSGQIWARPRDGGGLEVGFSLPLYEEAFV
jgi:PAS domain S-box-containing protein